MRNIEFTDKPLIITDSDISEYKSFESLMDRIQVHAVEQCIYQHLKSKLIVGGLLVSLSLLMTYRFIAHQDAVKYNISSYENPIGPEQSIQMTVDTVSLLANRTGRIDQSAQESLLMPVTESLPIKRQSNVPDEKKEDSEDQPSHSVEYGFVNAEPVGGATHLYQYFNDNLKYPAVKDSLEGEVMVKFTISVTGVIKQILIEKSLGDEFDREAIRLLENMPAWSPAKLNGKAVDSQVSVPIYFKIDKK